MPDKGGLEWVGGSSVVYDRESLKQILLEMMCEIIIILISSVAKITIHFIF